MYSEKYETTVNHFCTPNGVEESHNPIDVTVYYNSECPLCGLTFNKPFLDDNGVLKMSCSEATGRTVYLSYAIKYSDGTEKSKNLVSVVDDENAFNLVITYIRKHEPYVVSIEVYVNDEAPENELLLYKGE